MKKISLLIFITLGLLVAAPAFADTQSFSSNLSYGMANNADIKALQQFLTAQGDYSGPISGNFFTLTQQALKKFQQANGISPASGYFGPLTRSVANNLLSQQKSSSSTQQSSVSSTSVTNANQTTGTTMGSVGTGLGVSLAPTSPNGKTILVGQAGADLGDFIFTNALNTPIHVASLTFTRLGTANDSTFTNLSLYTPDKSISGSFLNYGLGVSHGQFLFNLQNSGTLFDVPAGGSYTVSVHSDIADGTSGQQVGVQLTSLTTNDGFNNISTDPINPPISSGYQTVATAPLQEQATCGTLANTAYQTQIQGWNSSNVWFKYLDKIHYNVALNECFYEYTVSVAPVGNGNSYDFVINAATNQNVLSDIYPSKGSPTYTSTTKGNVSLTEYNQELNYYLTN